MRGLLESFNVSYSTVNIKSIVPSTMVVDFGVNFLILDDTIITGLFEVLSRLQSSNEFGEFTTQPRSSGLYVFETASKCKNYDFSSHL